MKPILSLLVAAMIATPTAAQAQAKERTVQSLYQECKAPETLELMSCVRYLQGVAIALVGNGILYRDQDRTRAEKTLLYPVAICVPEGVTGGQLRQVFINWAEKNPLGWNQSEGIGPWVAFQDAWPCPLPN